MTTLSTNLNYKVLLPSTPSPLAKFNVDGEFDLLSLSDNTKGTLNSAFTLKPCVNTIVEHDRFRTGTPSTAQFQVVLRDAGPFIDLYDGDCLFSMTVEYYPADCGDCWESLELVTGVQVESAQYANLASCSTVTGEPLVAFPVRWHKKHKVQRDLPIIYEELNALPLDLVFCGSPSCSVCCGGQSKCNHVFGLFGTLSGYVIGESFDCGNDFNAWYQIPPGIAVCSLTCWSGRLILGTQATDAGNIYWLNSNDEDITNNVAQAGPIGADVVKVDESGQVIYALWQDGANWGVDASENGGVTWITLHTELDSMATDMDVTAASWAVASDTGIVVNGNNLRQMTSPVTGQRVIPIRVAIDYYDFRHPNCTVIYGLGVDGIVYGTIDHNVNPVGVSWSTVLQTEVTDIQAADLISCNNGHVVWLMVQGGDMITKVYKVIGRDAKCMVFENLGLQCPECEPLPDYIATCGDEFYFTCGGDLVTAEGCGVESEILTNCAVNVKMAVCEHDCNKALIAVGSLAVIV